jgi:hypothetical protein
MKKFNWSYEEAYIFLKKKRPQIQPNISFENQLKSLISEKV